MVSISDLRDQAGELLQYAVPGWLHVAVIVAGFLLLSIPFAFLTSLSQLGAPLPIATLQDGDVRCNLLLRCTYNTNMQVVWTPLNALLDLLLLYAASVFTVFGYRGWQA